MPLLTDFNATYTNAGVGAAPFPTQFGSTIASATTSSLLMVSFAVLIYQSRGMYINLNLML